jgi:prefoldin subunit 5
LKNKATETIERIKERIAELDSQTKVLQLALASAKVSHRIGEMDDAFFNSITNMIQTGMNRITSERKDLEASVAELEKLLTAPPALPKTSKEGAEALVVRIKE